MYKDKNRSWTGPQNREENPTVFSERGFEEADHCLAFFRMVPTAEMTVVLVPLAVVVTETTEGRVAEVVMRAGWARVTGMAESHLLFLFWASGGGERSS